MRPHDTAAQDHAAADQNNQLLPVGRARGDSDSDCDLLPALRRQFPAFDIWRDSFGERSHYTARRRFPWAQPHTLVTTNPGELRNALIKVPGHPFTDSPESITDDYPGWTVSYSNGQWTASCPAITVHADTAAGLRAGIEQAVCPDSDSI